MKRTIRLTESELNKFIKKIIRENRYPFYDISDDEMSKINDDGGKRFFGDYSISRGVFDRKMPNEIPDVDNLSIKIIKPFKMDRGSGSGGYGTSSSGDRVIVEPNQIVVLKRTFNEGSYGYKGKVNVFHRSSYEEYYGSNNTRSEFSGKGTAGIYMSPSTIKFGIEIGSLELVN